MMLPNRVWKLGRIFVFVLCFILFPSTTHPEEVLIQTTKDLEQKAKVLSSQWSGEAIRQSIVLYRQAAKQREEAKDHLESANNLREISKQEILLADYENAISTLKQTLQIESTHQLIDEKAKTLSLLSLASMYLGENNKSRFYLDKALELSTISENPESKAMSFVVAADFFYNGRDFSKASEHYQNSVEMWKKIGRKENEAYVLVSYSYVFMATGESSIGIEKAREAENLFLEINNKRGLALSRIAIGHLYNTLDKKQSALENYKKAEETFPDDIDFLERARLLNGIGLIYEDFGEWELSLATRQKALNLFKKDNYLQGQLATLPSLVKLSYQTGNEELAADYFSKTRQLSGKLDDEFFLAITQKQIGDHFLQTNQDLKALEYYKKSFITIKKLKSNEEDLALIENNLGEIYVRQGNLSLARKYFDSSLEISQKVQNKFAEANTLYNLAKLSLLEDKEEDALKVIEKSIRLTEAISSEVVNAKLTRTFFSTIYERHEIYIHLLMKMHRRFPDKKYDQRALQISERSRSRSMLESLYQADANFMVDADPDIVQREREIRSLISLNAVKLTKFLGNNAPLDEVKKLDTEINKLKNKLEEIKGELKQKSPVYSSIKNPMDFDVIAFQKSILDEKTLLLEFSLGEEESYVWLIGKDESDVFVLPKREILESQVNKLRELLISSRIKRQQEGIEAYQKRIIESEKEYNRDARVLSNDLFGQFAGKLSDKRLLIVPDGKLRYFPVSALPFPNEDTPFLLKNEIVYEPSASTLKLLQIDKTKLPPKDFLVFADPVYSKDDSRITTWKKDKSKEIAGSLNTPFWDNFRSMDSLDSLQRLPASQEEAKSIAKIFGSKKSNSISDFSANRKRFLESDISNYKIIHFATHGWLNEERPELSGIVLSKYDEKGNEQDGFIRLQDIYGLNLSASLVVLSACDTGIGKEIKGEGLMSLTNGFLQVGAKTIISSRWKVDDDATLELMKDFYQIMANENSTPSESLRKAQIKMYGESSYKSPFYWAAFTVQGNYQSKLQLSNSFDYKNYWLSIISILILFGLYRSYKTFR